MTDKVLLPCANGEWLAMSQESFQKALQQGADIVPKKKTKQTNYEDPIWFRVSDVARLCKISETYLRDEIRLGNIPSRKFSSGVRIHRDYLEYQTDDLVRDDDDEQ